MSNTQGSSRGDSLAQLPVGHRATVTDVSGDDVLARRLRDLGFWPGTEVHVIRRAPFGDPTQYWLRGYRIALRRDEASRIVVEAAAAHQAVMG